MNFLHYLPKDLVEYMQHITELNRARNLHIISEAKELNTLLLSHNINPVFLKGTGNLLEDLYEDIAERMVGDIDFVFSTSDYPKAIELILENGYSKVHKSTYDYPYFKHYPRLQKENKIAAVEIHKELLLEKHANEFNYDLIAKDIQKINDVHLLSYKNQLALSIIATQLNDDGFHYRNISLRNAYDVFLLSKKTDAKTAFDSFISLKNPLNCFLATSFEVFNKPKTLQYNSTPKINAYLNTFHEEINSPRLRNIRSKRTARKLFIQNKLNKIYRLFTDNKYRMWIKNCLKDKTWWTKKGIECGLIKA
jgi:hypothetical protein